MKRLDAVPLLLALVIACTAAAETVPERWHRLSVETSAQLKNAQYDKALSTANTIIHEMVAQLGPGQKSTEVFGRIVTYKALALAGLGRKDEAIWWWQSVLAMYPAYAKSDLSPFGQPGQMLLQNSVPTRSGVPRVGKNGAAANIAAPKVLRRVEPEFPAGASSFGVAGKIVLEVVITKDGRVVSPRILESLPAPTIAYTALDAVRQWRFEPGKLDGKPVAVIFNLSISYKM